VDPSLVLNRVGLDGNSLVGVVLSEAKACDAHKEHAVRKEMKATVKLR
jgi:hypothetical protein